MPEIVQTYIDNKDKFWLIRERQNNLLQSYKSDFSKYSWFANALHILHVFEAVSSQLVQAQDENVKKFKFSWIIPKKKWFNDLIWPLTFLPKSNLVIKSFIVNKADSPLRAYIKNNYFKLYFFDNWLLNASLNILPKDILLDSLNSYKWFIVENFVACELRNMLNTDLISWQEWNAEVEFLLETENWVVPIEVKSSKKYRRSKSLDSFILRYNPKKAFKLTLENYYKSNRWYEVLPLYLVSKINF
jgi:predicted AAA+ superfamily ATPase